MRILVIEDTSKHLDDAKRFFAEQQGVQAIYAMDYVSARRFLEKGKVDGVISDIYFPYKHELHVDPHQLNHNQPEAIGVSVVMVCRERKIPCILNTDGNHHGPRYQWICDMLGMLGLPSMVDTASDKSEIKHWQQAFDSLRALIGGGTQGDPARASAL